MELDPAAGPDTGEQDGPPVTWRPQPEEVAACNLGRFMAELGFATYGELHVWSATERAAFWEKVVARLGIVLHRPPERLLDLSGREGSRELTVTTLGELDGMARRFACGLARLGLGEGDGVALYMPMTVECVAAYLGTVRAGFRVVSIADSFAPPQVRRRLELGGAEVVVTVERFVRAGRRGREARSWCPPGPAGGRRAWRPATSPGRSCSPRGRKRTPARRWAAPSG